MRPGSYTYPYPRPMVTVDALLLAVKQGILHALFIKRGHAPWKGSWAIPGGFVDMDENLGTAAARELAEETGITGIDLTQFGTFGDVGRDPRGRVITVAYLAVVDGEKVRPVAGDDAAATAWLPVRNLPQLASDHNLMTRAALDFLQLYARAGKLPDLVPASVDLGDFLAALNAARSSSGEPL